MSKVFLNEKDKKGYSVEEIELIEELVDNISIVHKKEAISMENLQRSVWVNWELIEKLQKVPWIVDGIFNLREVGEVEVAVREETRLKALKKFKLLSDKMKMLSDKSRTEAQEEASKQERK